MSVLPLRGDVFISLYPYLSIYQSICHIFQSPEEGLAHCVCLFSRFSPVRLFATPWTVPCQTPLSLGFSRQEYWSGMPSPPPEDLPDSVIKSASPVSPSLRADSLPLHHQGNPAHSGSSVNIFGLIA